MRFQGFKTSSKYVACFYGLRSNMKIVARNLMRSNKSSLQKPRPLFTTHSLPLKGLSVCGRSIRTVIPKQLILLPPDSKKLRDIVPVQVLWMHICSPCVRLYYLYFPILSDREYDIVVNSEIKLNWYRKHTPADILRIKAKILTSVSITLRHRL
jgi:hypothetical protein